VALSTFATPSVGIAETAKPEDMLRFIRHFEARGSYDRYYSGIKVPPPKPLTQLTVGEVLAWRNSLRGTKSTASGAYQFIRPTLERLVRTYKIPKSKTFNAALQDQLAQLLISECPDRDLPKDNLRFGNCLATIWTALPVLSGPKKGQSHYKGIAGNRALTTPENVMAMLSGGQVTYEATPFRTPSQPSDQIKFRTIKIYHFDRGGNSAFKLAGPSREERISQSSQKAQENGGLGKSIHTIYAVDPYASN
jgi:hypothetical protein